MAVPCALPQQAGLAGIGAPASLLAGCGAARVPPSPSTARWCTRAAKKSPSTSTSTSGREEPATSRSRSSGGRKGSLTEKPLPAQNGGKTAGRASKTKSGSGSATTVEMDLSRVASLPAPHPPAGFALDEDGGVALVAPAATRIVTIVDPATQRQLECMIRRAFHSSDGQKCLLLLPLDMPLQILKIDEENEGLSELSDEELQDVLPSAVYALARRRLHLILSGFCLTARGGFCYTEEHVLDFKAEYGEGLGGSLTEGVEIANFLVKHTEYIVYTPFDPVMFVARQDESTGQLIIADDDLLDDEEVLGAIDEENEFQSLVEEEEAMREALRVAR